LSYLIFQDFKRIIQGDNLLQVIGNDLTLLNGIELTAQAEAVSYLVQKYITTQEFTDTDSYNPAIAYKAGQRVYLDAKPYNAASTYLLGELTLQAGLVYVSNVAITVPEAFTRNKWIYLGNQYDLFYVGYPFPKFNLYGTYKIGDKVWWSDKVYTCTQATIVYSHQTQLDTNVNQAVNNVVPNDPNSGTKFWGTGIDYSVPAGTLYTDPLNDYTPAYYQTLQAQYTASVDGETVINLPVLVGNNIIQIEKEIKPLFKAQYSADIVTGDLSLIGISMAAGESLFILYSGVTAGSAATTGAWVKGDNRNAQLVMYCCDIALFHIHSRIAPRNIPDLRVKRYDDAIKWLKMAGRGEITPALPVIQPLQGNRIRYNSQIKQVNNY
jgi:hypothetical protein